MTIQNTTNTTNKDNNNNNKQQNKNANKPELFWLYDSRTQALLKQAHEQAVKKQQQEDAAANRLYPVVRTYDDVDYDQLSLPSEEEQEGDEEGEDSSSSMPSSSSEEEQDEKESSANKSNGKQPKQPKATKKKELTPKQTRRLQQEIHQHCSNLIKTTVPLTIMNDNNEDELPDTTAEEITNSNSPSNSNINSYTHNLQLPTALLSKSEQQYGTPVSKTKAFVDLSTQLNTTATNNNGAG
eukprot:CAMPEP_0113610078 /NCGR_PEP_ID=MMETSP0017_2-20120614/4834_1 /TAXON_ID=2856 /ORGANISM="Cylindrotheca closterium" /LENGTH=239 /DNA_ID=CAMNT_0000518941 /DNA_START=24 /DNA_END=739 /DNA_ORIENTATION=- /assembly_acc=CAM_ASM_000147